LIAGEVLPVKTGFGFSMDLEILFSGRFGHWTRV